MMHGGNFMRGYGFGHGMVFNSPTNWWFGLIPMVAHLIIFIVIIGFALILFRRHGRHMQLLRKQNDPALKILRERYALGEIDTEEFQRRNRDLI